MIDLAGRRRRCEEMVRAYYADVPLRDKVLAREVARRVAGQAVLDAGCGSTMEVLLPFGPQARLAVGIDLETPRPAQKTNCLGMVANLERIPIRDATFDVVFSRSVCEHLEHPLTVFQELARVLRPGGTLIITTPSKYDYGSLVAALTPTAFHRSFLRRVFGGGVYDNFPVFYRINTAGAFRRVAARVGLEVVSVRGLRHYPYYLMFSPRLFRVGVWYDRLITRWGLDALQPTILAVLRKPAEV